MHHLRILLFLILLTPGQLPASDLAREQRMASEIVDTLIDGEALELNAESQDFLGIYTEADQARGAVLILHGRGFHPDWPDAIHPLRVQLPEYGWNTLSIQLPVLEKQAKYNDYVPLFAEAVPRIQAAIEFLKQQGNDKIVLLAHSCGAHMAFEYLREHGDTDLSAFIGLGMGATDYGQPMRKTFPLSDLKVPVLDVFGSFDYPAVQRMAGLRWMQIAEAGNSYSRQQVVPGANHYYTDRGDILQRFVSTWLDTLP